MLTAANCCSSNFQAPSAAVSATNQTAVPPAGHLVATTHLLSGQEAWSGLVALAACLLSSFLLSLSSSSSSSSSLSSSALTAVEMTLGPFLIEILHLHLLWCCENEAPPPYRSQPDSFQLARRQISSSVQGFWVPGAAGSYTGSRRSLPTNHSTARPKQAKQEKGVRTKQEYDADNKNGGTRTKIGNKKE